MYDHYKITTKKASEIIDIRNQMLNSIYYDKELYIILYEEPEGTPRPRARIIQEAKNNSSYIRMYSLTGQADKKYMKRLISKEDFIELDQLIYTPCDVQYDVYLKTPNSFSIVDKFLAELGYINPITKPDFDNIEKKYSDMFNETIWLDDSLVISCTFKKYYSILPRVEIKLRYLNMLYNKYQYNSIKTRLIEGSSVDYFKKD